VNAPVQGEPTSSRWSAVLLRAEVKHVGAHLVTHTVGLSERDVTLACSLAPEIEAQVTLSFPGLVEPFDLGIRVGASKAPDGYGRPPVAVCTIISADAHARQTLAQLVALTQGPPENAELRRGSAYRCLLVEDNAFIRDLFAYGLQRYSTVRDADLTLELAGDAEIAWEMLGREPFDMAIVDHFLPAQTGAELIARMRAEPRLSNIPVVAMSVGGAEARGAVMAAGADLFLDKPVVLSDLFSTLDRLTARLEAR
jgi:CheY-like chemotaxis protein